MKILVLTKWFVRWNGASKVAYELSRRLQNRNSVIVAAYKGMIDEEWAKEIPVHELKGTRYSSLVGIAKVIRKCDPDVIHSHGLLGLGAKMAGRPYIVTNHSNWPMDWFISFRHFIAGCLLGSPQVLEMKLANKVVTVSYFSSKMMEALGIKSRVIYNGVDEALFQPSLGYVDLKHPALLFVGGIDRRKAEYLYIFMKNLNKTNKKAHLYIIGEGIDTKLTRQLSRLSSTTYLGIVKEIGPYYENADILIFPSILEACPLVPLEAQACGLPVVGFNVASLPEIVINGKTGILCPEDDVAALVDSVNILLENENLRKDLSENAKIFIRSKFTWERAVNQYVDVFEKSITLSN